MALYNLSCILLVVYNHVVCPRPFYVRVDVADVDPTYPIEKLICGVCQVFALTSENEVKPVEYLWATQRDDIGVLYIIKDW